MDGSAIKGDMVGLNDSDAGIRKSSSMMSRIVVEGYDTSLPAFALVNALREHFASCGEVIQVHIPGYVSDVTPILNRFALIYLRGEGAQEKALELSGSYMEGDAVFVKAYPFDAKHLDPVLLARTRVVDNWQDRRMTVTGYDTSLPADHVKSKLIQHFSKCGHVLSASVRKDVRKGALSSLAFVTLGGQDAIEKALQLGGCDDEEGLKNVEVSRVHLPDPAGPSSSRAGKFPNNPSKNMNLILDT